MSFKNNTVVGWNQVYDNSQAIMASTLSNIYAIMSYFTLNRGPEECFEKCFILPSATMKLVPTTGDMAWGNFTITSEKWDNFLDHPTHNFTIKSIGKKSTVA